MVLIINKGREAQVFAEPDLLNAQREIDIARARVGFGDALPTGDAAGVNVRA